VCLLVVNVVEAAGTELILNAPTLWSQPDKNSKATIHSEGGLIVIVVILKLKLGFYSDILVVVFFFLSFFFCLFQYRCQLKVLLLCHES
jgi:hypothetical protein